MKLIFRKTEKTTGYFGKINGEETFSVLNVSLDFIPITVDVKERAER
jgi:hypothetical protein